MHHHFGKVLNLSHQGALSRFSDDVLSQALSYTSIIITHNQLETLPEKIDEFTNLEKLDCSYNNLTTIPACIWKLPKLKVLNLSHNRLTRVPNKIEMLENLEKLILNHNRIDSLPDSVGNLRRLQKIELKDNRLAKLPQSLNQLLDLDRIFLSGNRALRHPTLKFSSGFTFDMLEDFLEYSNHEAQPLNQMKVIFLGDGTTGKTSLIHRITGKNDSEKIPDPDKTDGIGIHTWESDLRQRKRYTLHIWDFGGQEIYHDIHQFFLTEQAVYVLVCVARAHDRAINYWLRLIKDLGKDAPIIICVNKKDKDDTRINEMGFKSSYENIKKIIYTSTLNEHQYEKTIKQLKSAIIEVSKQHLDYPQKHFRKEFQSFQNSLKNKIEKKMSIDEFEVFINNKIKNLSPKRRHLYIQTLRHLGIIMNYPDNEELKKIIILDPFYITKVIYTIIESKEIGDRLSPHKLLGILQKKGNENGYTEAKDRKFILNLMEKFKLAYEFKGEYLIPNRLSAQEPNSKINLYLNNAPEQLGYKVEYIHYFPKSVILKLIVRLHEKIKEELVWKNGLILESNGCLAKVFCKVDKNEIEVKVGGADKHNLELFFQEIRSHILDINKKMKLSTIEEVPFKDKWLGIEELKNYRNYYHNGNKKNRLPESFFHPRLNEEVSGDDLLLAYDKYLSLTDKDSSHKEWEEYLKLNRFDDMFSFLGARIGLIQNEKRGNEISELERTLLSLQSRYERLKQDKSRGVIDLDKAETRHNQIREDVMDLYETISKPTIINHYSSGLIQ